MNRNILWAVVSSLMALSLVIAACGPAATPATPPTPTAPISQPTPASPAAPATPTRPVEEKTQKEPVAPSAEVPKYGGTITFRTATDPVNFDSGLNRRSGVLLNTVYQQYMGSDWTTGPAGSGTTDWAAGATTWEVIAAPQLAESWKMPQQGVWILNIRRGVHWQKPNTDAGRLMNGREVTADDIVSSWNRLATTPTSWMHLSQPVALAATSVNKTGPWQVTFNTRVDYLTSFFWIINGGGYNRVYPPEVVAKYGDLGNWRNAVGTGPFMLVDYVPGSQLLFVKNPDYWEKDPIGPGKGNQLPYVDTARELIIPDLSTTLAALRTGKIDLLSSVLLEDGRNLIKTNPQLQHLTYLAAGSDYFAMRQDKKDKPYSNIKVRQALTLATDFEAIKRDYYKGEAEIDVFPTNLNFKGVGAYMPLAEMPQSVQDLYKYNPDKAKQLLAEAGYPNGFKATVVVSSGASTGGGAATDEVAIFKDMWAKVGINLVLDVKEVTLYNTIVSTRNYDDMLYRSMTGGFPTMFYFSPIRGTSVNNPSYINEPIGADPVIEATFQAMEKVNMINMPEFFRLFKELRPHLVAQAYQVVRPLPYIYNFWWPWLKNYYGQATSASGVANVQFIRYHWIDQAMKKSMGY